MKLVKLVKLEPGETVWLSFIVYRSQAHRNAVSKQVVQAMEHPMLPEAG